MTSKSGTATGVSQQNAIPSVSSMQHAIKIPRFWRENPSLWFVQVEAQFALNGIDSEQKKYYIIIAELETELLTHVSDIVLNPPEDVYTQLKKRLIEHFSVSEEKRIKQLLNNMEIGDKKPSVLLREMKNLANGGVNDDFLRTMWMQRLPTHIHAILSTSSESLEAIAKMADKIADVSTPSGISSVAVGNTSFDLSAMSKQIEVLTAAVQQLHETRSRQNSSSRTRSNSRTNSNASGICYYHRRFGQRANKCRQPCTFKSNQKPGNQ
ncbi:uncharacterized protein [Musca autumnalis]|uniref:uncharacterized protein n=1 Tax=Musca autumnalis TaxID=221902 RepID=UPI003CEA33F3